MTLNTKGTIYIIFCVFANFISQIFFNDLSKNVLANFDFRFSRISELLQLLLEEKEFYFAMLFYALSALFWLIGIKKLALSRAFSITSLNYVLITIYSFIILTEGFTFGKVLSCILISLGIIIMNLDNSVIKRATNH